jgi:hypothetical protein
VAVVAISADAVEDMAALQTKLPRVRLLSAKLPAVAAWGALLPGAEQPSPMTFIVGRDGVIRWRHLLQPAGDWPTLAQLTAALDAK